MSLRSVYKNRGINVDNEINGATFLHQVLKNQAAIMGVLVEQYTPKVCESSIGLEKRTKRAHMNAVLSSNYQATRKLLDMLGEGEYTWLD